MDNVGRVIDITVKSYSCCLNLVHVRVLLGYQQVWRSCVLLIIPWQCQKAPSGIWRGAVSILAKVERRPEWAVVVILAIVVCMCCTGTSWGAPVGTTAAHLPQHSASLEQVPRRPSSPKSWNHLSRDWWMSRGQGCKSYCWTDTYEGERSQFSSKGLEKGRPEITVLRTGTVVVAGTAR